MIIAPLHYISIAPSRLVCNTGFWNLTTLSLPLVQLDQLLRADEAQPGRWMTLYGPRRPRQAQKLLLYRKLSHPGLNETRP